MEWSVYICWVYLVYSVVQACCFFLFCLGDVSVEESGRCSPLHYRIAVITSSVLLIFAHRFLSLLFIFVFVVVAPLMDECHCLDFESTDSSTSSSFLEPLYWIFEFNRWVLQLCDLFVTFLSFPFSKILTLFMHCSPNLSEHLYNYHFELFIR